MAGNQVGETLDEMVREFLRTCRYLNEPLTRERARVWLLQHDIRVKHFNSRLKPRVASKCPHWDVRLRILKTCMEEVIDDPTIGRPHTQLIKEVGQAIGIPTAEFDANRELPPTTIGLHIFENIATNGSWLEGWILGALGERIFVGTGKGSELEKYGLCGLEEQRYQQVLGCSKDDVFFFTYHRKADAEHTADAWAAVARYAREERLEDRVLAAAGTSIWVHRLLWDGPLGPPGLLDSFPATSGS